MKTPWFPRSFLTGLILLLSSVTVLAQLDKGSWVGTFTDPKGGLVPGADVVLTQDQTQTRAQFKTDLAGYYFFTALTLGTYTLTVTAQGFKGFKQSGIALNVGGEGRADVKLALGT